MRADYETTAWAREFREIDERDYKLAVEMALKPGFTVDIIETNERGRHEWAIVPHGKEYEKKFGCFGFWMDARAQKESALIMCREMGWDVAEIIELSS